MNRENSKNSTVNVLISDFSTQRLGISRNSLPQKKNLRGAGGYAQHGQFSLACTSPFLRSRNLGTILSRMDAPTTPVTATSPLAVQTKFDSIQSLRNACATYAIDNAFEYKVLWSSQTRYTITCKAEGCPWRLHGSTVNGASFCRIKTYNDEHTCFGLNHIGHAQASSAFIANQIAEKVKEQPTYRPVDIVKDVHRTLGVKIGYTKAWNAKERANELNHGTHNAAYQALPKYCADIVASNPNSVAFVEKTPDDKFKRLFICYGACALGFSYCRPLVGLDGTHLKTTFQGTPSYHSV
jgi:MuDR family transposase